MSMFVRQGPISNDSSISTVNISLARNLPVAKNAAHSKERIIDLKIMYFSIRFINVNVCTYNEIDWNCTACLSYFLDLLRCFTFYIYLTHNKKKMIADPQNKPFLSSQIWYTNSSWYKNVSFTQGKQKSSTMRFMTFGIYSKGKNKTTSEINLQSDSEHIFFIFAFIDLMTCLWNIIIIVIDVYMRKEKNNNKTMRCVCVY